MTDTVTPPSPSTVLRQFRRARELTMEEMATALDTSKQNISNYESGKPIPFERIRDWATSPAYEFWVKELAYQLWIAHQYQEIAELNANLTDLQTVVSTQLTPAQ